MLDALILAAIAVIVGTLWYFGVGPVIYGTIMVGGTAAVLARLSARDQVRVAERKMFLDLLDKRIAWHTETRRVIQGYYNFIFSSTETIINGESEPDSNDWLELLVQQQMTAQWLFGPEIEDELIRGGEALGEYEVARMTFRRMERNAHPIGFDPEDDQMVRDEHRRTHGRFLGASSSLQHAIKPYIYVGDIKQPKRLANQPAWVTKGLARRSSKL